MPNTSKQVLICDGDQDLLSSLKSVLSEQSYQVSCVSCCKDAVRALEGNRFDAIVSDLQMPGEDGQTLFHLAQRQFPSLPFVMMTQGDVSQLDHALKRGASQVLVKPFERNDLIQALEDAIDHEEERARAASQREEQSPKSAQTGRNTNDDHNDEV